MSWKQVAMAEKKKGWTKAGENCPNTTHSSEVEKWGRSSNYGSNRNGKIGRKFSAKVFNSRIDHIWSDSRRQAASSPCLNKWHMESSLAARQVRWAQVLESSPRQVQSTVNWEHRPTRLKGAKKCYDVRSAIKKTPKTELLALTHYKIFTRIVTNRFTRRETAIEKGSGFRITFSSWTGCWVQKWFQITPFSSTLRKHLNAMLLLF